MGTHATLQTAVIGDGLGCVIGDGLDCVIGDGLDWAGACLTSDMRASATVASLPQKPP